MIFFENRRNTRMQIGLTGEVHIPAPNCHFARRPSEFILYYIQDGHMKLKEDEIVYSLAAGDVLILDPECMHVGLLVNADISYAYIHFTWDGVKKTERTLAQMSQILVENRMKEELPIVVFPKYTEAVANEREHIRILVDDILQLQKGVSEYARAMASCKLWELLIQLGLMALKREEAQRDRATVLTQELLQYIHQHANQNLCSHDIEAHFHMNFDYLNRCFKKNTRDTILNYSNHFRIRESQKLLRCGAYSVRQVAYMMGFSNEFYFSKVYKKYMGIPPIREIEMRIP